MLAILVVGRVPDIGTRFAPIFAIFFLRFFRALVWMAFQQLMEELKVEDVMPRQCQDLPFVELAALSQALLRTGDALEVDGGKPELRAETVRVRQF